MSANTNENIQTNTSPLQSWVFRFVAVIAILLIVMPILPMLISNLAYSFSGEKPKIYWYLSRAGGFVTLTILWAAMAMGIGITNKMVRLWPGAPTAFSIHQYTSLLGLAFAAYHGLVLMGDHYTDFSLPRLLTPFSIDYKTFWIGLGQTSFYLWVLVVLSFYVRQFIGQKTWRVIHYVNFVTYAMGFSHSLMTGTDSNATWARGYFWISGISIVALLIYRIYETSLKNKISLPKFGFKRQQTQEETPAVSKATNLPRALLREQARTSTSAPTTDQPETKPVAPLTAKAVDETPAPPVANEIPQQPVVQQGSAAPVEISAPEAAAQTPAVPVETPASAPVEPPLKIHSKPSSPIETIQDDSKGNKIRVRIFKEPTTLPIPELQNIVEEMDGELQAIFIRVKQSFRAMPVEPPNPKRRAQKVIFSND